MTVTVTIAGVLLGAAALAAVVRLVRGPGPIDRTAALDVLLAIVVATIVLVAAANASAVTLTLAVVVSLLGFIGSAGLALLLGRGRR